MLMLGDPYLEILAQIYEEFQRWRVVLRQIPGLFRNQYPHKV
jgi:hypothetical protein